ncbi:ATP-dependent zinc metalloprotease FtsH [Candidatus Wolfebacteria bacterium]|nr:ATP-dependent zinc metalloprotease FtsH [Candidatus Wolfebacteria bacterium]
MKSLSPKQQSPPRPRPKPRGPAGGGPSLPPRRPFWLNALTTVLLFLLLISAYSFIVGRSDSVAEVPISELAALIRDGDVQSIVVRGDDLDITEHDGEALTSKKETDASFTETLERYGVSEEDLARVTVSIENESGFMFWLGTLAPFLIPLLFIAFFIWFLTRQVKGAGVQAFTFGQSRARFIDPKDKNQRVTFDDVAGNKEAKEELMEIVDFLKNPKKFLAIGARIPKGVILMGAPGTGKTLMAQAVAGTAGVPFFSISGSEFVEMFVGVGASRVRDTFRLAKKAAPAIIFIDEIDAVGRVRGTGVGGGNDEREQTLNQILVEMDGFEPNEKVIVMAATNRWDVLDPALLRTGRFDRRVRLDLPDRNDREAILEIHARRKPLGEDVNLRVIAERTPGLSGADLQSLMNEGAILAAREDRKKISQYDLIRSIEKVMLGPERKSHILTKKEKEITAYHEAGHALVGSVLPHADPVHKVSVIARGHAGGYTISLPLEERRLRSKKDFLDQIAMTLGGYAAEEMVFGDITTGPSNDLQVASAIARDMVTRYGMSEKIGPIALEGEGGRTMFGHPGVDREEYSDKLAEMIDAEVEGIMREAQKRAKQVLTKHRKALDAIVVELMDKETLEQGEFEEILKAHGIKLKKDEQAKSLS